MKTAVLEFQRNRVKRQQSGAASVDILKTIVELRSALQSIGKAILAVERLAFAQTAEGTLAPRKPASPKKRSNASKAKRKGRLVVLPHTAQYVEDPAPADRVVED
jgi:hypothetical protein